MQCHSMHYARHWTSQLRVLLNCVDRSPMLSDSALQKKRQFAEERAARLRDPRVRCLGIDKTALDEQVKERKRMEEMEKDRDRYFDQQRVAMDKHAQVLQREVNQLRATRESDVQSFRDTYQKKEMRREWDLNDPKRVIGALPARVNDGDPRCGPSSVQKFEGEDLDMTERRRLQRDQQKQWAEQQMEEKLVKKWAEADTNRQYEDRAEEVAHRTYQVEQSIASQRREAARTTAEFNKAMSQQKKQDTVRTKFDQTQKNLEEIENLMNSDLLCENSGGRPGRANFKGMTHDERQNIARIQAAQREMNQQRKLQEAEDAKQQEMQEMMQMRMAMTLDRQRERERTAANRDLGEERKKQAAEARDRKKATDELYKNEIGEEYFVYGKCL